jgi:exonuclease III
MNMKIISLNAQGLTDFSKFKRIILKLLKHSPDIILFQEAFNPHISTPDFNFKLRTWASMWKGQIYATPLVATLVSPSFKSTLRYKSNDHRILDITISTPQHPQINIRNIYAPADVQQQRPFWAVFPLLPPTPNIVAGDFNAVFTAEDHISSTNFHRTPLDTHIFHTLKIW